MKRFIWITKNALKLGFLSSFAILNSPFKHSLCNEITENFQMIHLEQLKDENVLIVLDMNLLMEEYQKKSKAVIDYIQSHFPELKIINISSQNLGDYKLSSDNTFFLLKKKNSNKIKEIDFGSALHQSYMIVKYFEEMNVLKDYSSLQIDKFHYLIGYCEENEYGERFLQELKTKQELTQQSLFNFIECSKLNSSPQDLIILKKNSKFNSLTNNEVLDIDGKRLDIMRIKDFLKKDQTPDNDFLELLLNKMNQLSVFSPLFLQSFDQSPFDFQLQIDLNKISSRKKHKLFTQIKNIKEEIGSIPFYFIKTSQEEKYQLLLQISRKIKMTMFVKHHNKSLDFLQQLKRENPFLEDSNNSFSYLFPKSLEISSENVLSFVKKANNNEITPFYQSEKPKDFKISFKNTYADFQNLLKDEKDHVIMFYSRHCPGCKGMGKYFEMMALENIQKQEMPNLQFHRINNELNSFFSITPVFIYLKNNHDNPYYFQADLTKENLENFIINTYKMELIDDFKPIKIESN